MQNINKKIYSLLPVIIGLILIAACSKKDIGIPASKEIIHFDEYHGQKISDPYRWLEDFTNDEVKEWVRLQNNYSQKFVKNRFQKSIKQDLELIWTSEYVSTPFKVQDKIFYYFNTGKLEQNRLMIRDCESCPERILIDPNNFSNDGTVSLASVSVSPNAEWIAFAKSDGGSDWRTWKIMNIASGEIPVGFFTENILSQTGRNY